MRAQDLLTAQYHFFYLTAKANLEGLTQEDSLKQPDPGGNCTNWLLAHTIGAHNAVAGLLGQDPIFGDEVQRAHSEPITDPDDALDFEAMREALIASEERIVGAISALTDEQLDEGGFEDPFGNAVTRGELLNLLAVHGNYHAGQLGMSRRLAGYPGAIDAPGGSAV